MSSATASMASVVNKSKAVRRPPEERRGCGNDELDATIEVLVY
jgi:hypothetical protein